MKQEVVVKKKSTMLQLDTKGQKSSLTYLILEQNSKFQMSQFKDWLVSCYKEIISC